MIPTVDHVAIAASSYAPHVGGVEELVRQLASEQLRGHGAPTVITMRWPKSLASAEVIDGVPVRRFLFRVPEGELKHRLLAYLAMPVTIARVALELRRSRAQVVHIQCVSSSAWFIEKATRFMGLPLVVTMQGELTMDADGVYERSAFLRTTLRRLLATADAVTACSRHTLEEAQEWAGIDLGGRGSVVYNGVRLSDFDEAESAVRESPYVFAVGRHVPQKGFDVLLDAFGRACGDSAFGWDLVIAGDGPEHDGLRCSGAASGSRRSHHLPRRHRPTNDGVVVQGLRPVRAALAPRAVRHREPRGNGCGAADRGYCGWRGAGVRR